MRAAALLLLGTLVAGCRGDGPPVAVAGPPDTLPPAIPDSTWVSLIDELSETGGYFDTDNLISNEASYLNVMGALRRLGVYGQAYVGVGPDQNFSYMAQQRPALAFIVDIRRDNLLQHLLFKALFDLAPTRVEYLALLNGRAPPPDPGAWHDASVEDLLQWVRDAPGGEGTPEAEAAVARVDSAVGALPLGLDDEDRATIRRFHRTFIAAGPQLQFNSYGRAPRPWYPTYAQLLLARDLEGEQGSYLALRDDYTFLREVQARNRVIPVVGDLAGPHALQAVGEVLRARDLVVRTLYASNVEFYLVRAGTFEAFAANVATLPMDGRSVLVRSVFPTGLFRPHPHTQPRDYSAQTMVRLRDFVRRAEGEGWRNYQEVVSVDAVDPLAARDAGAGAGAAWHP
jgi:hypothetical protein